MKIPTIMLRDEAYLAAIRLCPCIRCGWRPCEAAHIRLTSAAAQGSGAGMAQKPSDNRVVPLCAPCHRTGRDADHAVGTKEFWRRMGLDPFYVSDLLFRSYEDGGAAQLARAAHRLRLRTNTP